MKIVNVPFNNYKKGSKFKKDKIVLHGESELSVDELIKVYEKNGRAISCNYIIDKEGVIHELFPSSFASYHLGREDMKVEFSCISIVLLYDKETVKKSSKGRAKKADEKEDLQEVVKTSEEKFAFVLTPKTISSAKQLIENLIEKHAIKLNPKVNKSYDYIFNFIEDNSKYDSGVWTENTYRKGRKTTIKDSNLLIMLNNL